MLKRKRSKTAKKRVKRISFITMISLTLSVVLLLVYMRYKDGYETFKEPEHESTAVTGVPTVEEERHYAQLPVKEGYIVGVCATPYVNENELYLNMTNHETNTVWLKVRVYQGEQLIGESGILYPGEYMEKIDCSKSLTAGDSILVKTLAYSPDTFHSEGVAQISCELTQ
ncbi:MAG: hypothetical protein ACI4ES_16765 [Roseburia sp.]